MANYYNLNFNEINPLQVDTIYHKISKDDGKRVDIYAVDEVTFYHYVIKNNVHEKITQKYYDKPLEGQLKILCVIDLPDNLSEGIIVKHKEGINIYRYKRNQSFDLLYTDTRFNESVEFKTLQCDQFHNDLRFRILEHRKNENPKTLLITPEHFLNADQYSNIMTYKENFHQHITGINNADVSIVRTSNSPLKSILFRKADGLTVIYGFSNYRFIPCCERKPDEKWGKVFFADLTGQQEYDIVLLNNVGLYVYQQVNENDRYKLISFNPLFSENKGWLSEYLDTIHFEDVYMDSRQEMILNTPQGVSVLSFDYYSKEWNSILDHSKLLVSDRNRKVVDVMTDPVSGQVLIALKGNNQIKLGKFCPQLTALSESTDIIESESTDTEVITNPSTINLELVPLIDKSKDDLEDFNIKDFFIEYLDVLKTVRVDGLSGKPIVSLPLVDFITPLINIKLNFMYDANHKNSNILGLGWSIKMQNLIMFNHQSSVFPQDESYYLIFQNTPYKLICDRKKSHGDVIFFYFESNSKIVKNVKPNQQQHANKPHQNDIMVRYFKILEKWEIHIKGINYIYGKTATQDNNEAIIWELVWDNWRGYGNSDASQKQIATGWYLVKIEDTNGNFVQFDYNVVNQIASKDENTFDEKVFTREVYLDKIHDNYGSKIEFIYKTKNKEEYPEVNLKDSNGFYDKSLLCTKYLEKLSVQTTKFYYKLYFLYEVSNQNKRYLQAIVQEDLKEYRDHVWSCSYDETHYNLKSFSFLLDRMPEVSFNYKMIELPDVQPQPIKTIPTKNDYHINFGLDFILINHFDQIANEIVLQMFDDKMENEIIPFNAQSGERQWPKLSSSETYYTKQLGNAIILVTISKSGNSSIYWFYSKNDNWYYCPEPKTFDINTILKFSDNYLLLLSDEIKIYTIQDDGELVEEKLRNQDSRMNLQNKDKVITSVSDNYFHVYDDTSVWMGYKDTSNTWNIQNILTKQQILSETQNIIENFKLEEEASRYYKMLFSDLTLQSHQNILMLTKYKIENTKLKADIFLYILDKDRKIAYTEEKSVELLDITLIEMPIPVTDNGKKTTYHCGYTYQKSEKKFNLNCSNFIGDEEKKVTAFYNNLLEPINKVYAEYRVNGKRVPGHFIHEQLKQADLKKENFKSNIIEQFMNTHSQKTCILYSAVYLRAPKLSEQHVFANQKKFTFNGVQWNEYSNIETLTNMKLGNDYIIEPGKTINTYVLSQQTENGNKGKQLAEFKVDNYQGIVMRYPIYLAYQKDANNVEVIQFSGQKSIETYTLDAGKLSRFSSYQILITEKDNNLIFWSHFGLKHILPTPVVESSEIVFEKNSKHVTGYKYESSDASAIGGAVQFSRRELIPGNDKTRFGYIEEFQNLTRNFYNSKGTLVKTIVWNKEHHQKTDNNDMELPDYESAIYDKTGIYEIARFFPFRISEDDVGYIGFEDYETWTSSVSITNEPKWTFDNNAIITKGFSFTGKNFLRLKVGALKATFTPAEQNEIFVVSCWLRSSVLQLGKIFDNLKIIVNDKSDTYSSGRGTVILGETKLQSRNWFYVEAIINLPFIKEMQQQSNDSVAKIHINLDIGNAKTIDVDHIRFSPISCEFEALVYDPETKDITGKILSNGLVERYIHDKYQQQIAIVNEFAQLKTIKTYYKKMYTDNSVPNSITKIKPVQGFYEIFDPYSFQKLWKADNARKAWKIKPYSISHVISGSHFLTTDISKFNQHSFGFRFKYDLMDDGNIWFSEKVRLISSGGAKIVYDTSHTYVSSRAECIIIIEDDRIFIWIDGHLVVDRVFLHEICNDGKLSIKFENKSKIQHLVLFDEPKVHITYFNDLGEKMQEAFLETKTSAIYFEYLYDEIGRQDIITKRAKIIVNDNYESLLQFRKNFVTNKNPLDENSIWKTGRLEGEAAQIHGPYGFTKVIYSDDPMNNKQEIILPGEESADLKFAMDSKFSKRYAFNVSDDHLLKLYSPQNHTYHMEIKSSGVNDISVVNDKDRRVARYIQGSKNSLLTTYEYNDNNKLIKILPPVYHERVQTIENVSQTDNNHSNVRHHKQKEKEEMKRQQRLGTYMNYDKKGNLISKITPETAKTDFIYDHFDLLQFVVHYSDYDGKIIDNVVYLDYDRFGRLIETGNLAKLPTHKNQLQNPEYKNYKKVYQEIYYSGYELHPMLRSKSMRFVTHVDNTFPLIEEFITNNYQETINRRIIVPNSDDQSTSSIDLNLVFQQQKIKEIKYPAEFNKAPFHLVYSYDKLGRITCIGIPGQPNYFGEFSYNENNQLLKENHTYGVLNTFSRNYEYNSAGYLILLEDPFLSEEILYTSRSYYRYAHGDGEITKTIFKAKWHKAANIEKLSLKPNQFPPGCFDQLKNKKYINKKNLQERIYYPHFELRMPFNCTSDANNAAIIFTLETKGFPDTYGHSYEYNYLQQLTKAKYFTQYEMSDAPLHSLTFYDDPYIEVSKEDSQEIWKILNENGYVIEEPDMDLPISYGKATDSFMKPIKLDNIHKSPEVVKKLEINLKKVLAASFALDTVLNLEVLKEYLSEWSNELGNDDFAKKLFDVLQANNYINEPLDPKFVKLFMNYTPSLSVIVELLNVDFGTQLGKGLADIEFYNTDKNGNHLHFQRNLKTYRLNYEELSNKIKYLTTVETNGNENTFKFEHDTHGNVISAEYKKISKIDYHPTSKRPIKITMENGNTIEFAYDAQGGRILKKVNNLRNGLLKEINYIRDHKGQSLVEKETTYTPGNSMPDVVVTMYIYGPRGLFGFIRQNQFYSVITDHEGSIRLVVKNGEVVAAYDYHPYGSLLREFIEYPEADISYRYTGKEWDKEIELYNFHARLYDPEIGRFYQIDPREQYSSPYVYAGNSPVSVIDPDGEFAVLLTIAVLFTIAGAYLGAAAAEGNNCWNPVDWRWSSESTWGGILFGGLTGLLIPLGFTSGTAIVSAAAFASRFAIGVGVAYLSAAAKKESWNPLEWNMSEPDTYYAALSGFGNGSGMIKTYLDIKNFFKGLSTVNKAIFVTFGLVYASAVHYSEAGDDSVHPTNPKFWSGIANGISKLPEFPSLGKGFGKLIKRIRNSKILKETDILPGLSREFKNNIKTREHILNYLIKAAFTGVAFVVQGFQTNWDMTSVNTYYNLVSSIVQGSQASSVVKDIRQFKAQSRAESIRKQSLNNIKNKVTELEKDIEEQGQIVDSYLSMPNDGTMIFVTKVDKSETIMIISNEMVNSPTIKSVELLKTNSIVTTVDRIFDAVKNTIKNELNKHIESVLLHALKSFIKSETALFNINSQLKTQLLSGKPFTKSQLQKSIKNGLDSSVSGDKSKVDNNVVEKELRILREGVDYTIHSHPLRISEAEKTYTAVVSNPHSSMQLITKRKLNLEEAKLSISSTLWKETKTLLNKIWRATYDRTFVYWYSILERSIKFEVLKTYLPGRFVQDYRLRDIVSTPTRNQMSDSIILVQASTSNEPNHISTTNYISSVSSTFSRIIHYVVDRFYSTQFDKKYILSGLRTKSNNPDIIYPTHSESHNNRRKRAAFEAHAAISNTILAKNNNAIENDKKGFVSRWLNFSNVAKPQEFIKNDFKSSNITKVDISPDVNGILLLLNVFFRKITGEKFGQTQMNNTNPMEAQVYIASFIHEFENMLQEVAFELNLNYIEIDQISTMRDLREHIINGNYSKIPETLHNAVLKAIPDSEKTMKFLNSLQYHLDEMLTQNSSKLIPDYHKGDNLFDSDQHNSSTLEYNLQYNLNGNEDIWFDANSTFLLS